MKLNDKAQTKFTLTDQGYLVSKGVKLARVGAMEYLNSELGKSGNGITDVYVDAEQLFNDATIQSFEGMPITINHPEEMEVNAKNWEELTKGHITNIRPSDDKQFLLGDAIINSSSAIDTIQSGMIEVSCGYDADIEEINGKLTKVNIRGNHLAIVDEGRCGGDCKLNLNDGKPKEMTKRTMLDKILGRKAKKPAALKFGDAKAKITARKKSLNDTKADFDAKLKDAEAIVVDPNATPEEKAAVVQELQAESVTLMEEATSAIDEAQAATAQAEELAAQIEKEVPADGTTVTDADITIAEEELANLEAQLQEKDAKIAELEAELASLKEAEDKSTTMGDAKTIFTKATFKDSMSSKEIKATAVASTGAYSFADAMKLGDCALNSAYAAAKTALSTVKKPQIGSKLIANDAKGEVKIPAALKRRGA